MRDIAENNLARVWVQALRQAMRFRLPPSGTSHVLRYHAIPDCKLQFPRGRTFASSCAPGGRD